MCSASGRGLGGLGQTNTESRHVQTRRLSREPARQRASSSSRARLGEGAEGPVALLFNTTSPCVGDEVRSARGLAMSAKEAVQVALRDYGQLIRQLTDSIGSSHRALSHHSKLGVIFASLPPSSQ